MKETLFKWFSGAVLALAALLVIRYQHIELKRVQDDLARSEQKVHDLSEARARDARMYRERVALEQQETKRREAELKEVQRALNENPAWAGSRVPDGVLCALGVCDSTHAGKPGTGPPDAN